MTEPLELEGLKREVEAQIVAELKSWRDDPEYEVLARIAKLVELLLSTRNCAQGEADAWKARALTAEAALQSTQAELTRMREADGWQPIETAPKDGTPVDLWVEFPEHAKARRVPNALWNVEEGGWQLGQFLQSQFAVTPIIKYWHPVPGRPAALQQNGGEDA